MPKQHSQSSAASLKSGRGGKLLSLPMSPNPNDKKYKVARDASHHVIATIATCIDPRFLAAQFRYWTARYGEGKFEMPSHAGGAKQFVETAADGHYGILNLTIALEKHHAQEIVLATHEDCAAYGGSKQFKGFEAEMEFHKKQLAKAEQTILKKFPDVKIVKVFYTFDGPHEI